MATTVCLPMMQLADGLHNPVHTPTPPPQNYAGSTRVLLHLLALADDCIEQASCLQRLALICNGCWWEASHELVGGRHVRA